MKKITQLLEWKQEIQRYKAEDRVLFLSVINGTPNQYDSISIYDAMSAAYERQKYDPEMLALCERAVNVLQAAELSAWEDLILEYDIRPIVTIERKVELVRSPNILTPTSEIESKKMDSTSTGRKSHLYSVEKSFESSIAAEFRQIRHILTGE